MSEHWNEERLKKMLGDAYAGFYLRPRFVWRRLASIRSFNDVKDLMGGLKVLMAVRH